jgi:hypothetical protein
MSDVITYTETTVDDVRLMGDNTDRGSWAMMSPSLGEMSIVRYGCPVNKKSKVGLITAGVDFGAQLLSGAYTAAQDGARLQVRFDSTIKMEQKFNWTGLSGYIGGADDYGDENGLMILGYDMELATGTVIDLRVTGATNVRRMIYITLYGTLDDGTRVRVAVKQAVDGTTVTDVGIYTVPASRTLYWDCMVVSTRQIDLYAGKAYLVYNGLPVMSFDLAQSEIGAMVDFNIPLWEAPLAEGSSIALRLDDFEAGNEIVFGSVYAKETAIGGGGGGAARPIGSPVVRRIG